jgi:hypothetical protein
MQGISDPIAIGFQRSVKEKEQVKWVGYILQVPLLERVGIVLKLECFVEE